MDVAQMLHLQFVMMTSMKTSQVPDQTESGDLVEMLLVEQVAVVVLAVTCVVYGSLSYHQNQ